jgi:hypothetical protein
VREQAAIIGARLRRDRVASFRALVADADSTLVVVARFLALLELFRESSIAFEQAEALGELTVRWTGPRRATSRSTTSSTRTRRQSDSPPQNQRRAPMSRRMSDEHESADAVAPPPEDQLAFDVADFPGGIRARPRGGAHGRRRARVGHGAGVRPRAAGR